MLERVPGVIPEPSRDTRVSDTEWLLTLYPELPRQPQWWLEFRFLEDRSDGVKGPPVCVRFLRDPAAIVAHLKANRELAAQRARQLRESGLGPWPAALFWGVQPRLAKRGKREHVAAFVALTCDLDIKDWPELAEGERPRAAWEQLHTAAPTPSLVIWTGHGFHAYWLLRKPMLEIERGEEVQKAIARCLRGDHVQDCARLLRWPNSVNYKGVQRGQSRSVRVVWWHPELRYAFKTLAEHFLPFLEARSPVVRDRIPAMRLVWKRFYSSMDQDSALKALWEGRPCGLATHDRSTLDMALAHALVRHEFSQAAFATIAPLAPWNAQKALAPAYLARTWNKTQKRSSSSRASKLPISDADVRAAGEEEPICATSSTPFTLVPEPFLALLPESAWTDWARLYRAAVGPSTEAADELHYLALLTVLGAALGRTVTVSCGRPLHPNVYSMLIGPTGDRKSTAAQLALDLLRRVTSGVLLLNGLGSQEGLMERMAGAESGSGLHSRTLLFVDEMAALLKKGRRESSGSLIEFITEVFHCPDFKTHCTRSKAIHLENPTLSILAASTPCWLEAALQEEDILGGFTNRFVYVTAPAKSDKPLPALPDGRKLQELADWMRRIAQAPPRAIALAPDAKDLWSDFYVQWRRSLADQSEHVAALLCRVDIYILKFAAMNAAMDDTAQIALSHLTPAIDLGRYLAGCACRILGDLAAPRDCRLENLIEQKLLAAHGRMRRKHLRRILGGRVTGEKLDRILRAMERNGIIRLVEESTNGRPARLLELTPSE